MAKPHNKVLNRGIKNFLKIFSNPAITIITKELH